MVKVKKDCRFEYTLSYKAISIRYLEHAHSIYLNPFSFKVHETETRVSDSY